MGAPGIERQRGASRVAGEQRAATLNAPLLLLLPLHVAGHFRWPAGGIGPVERVEPAAKRRHLLRQLAAAHVDEREVLVGLGDHPGPAWRRRLDEHYHRL